MKDIKLIRKLVGDIRPQQMRHVDYAVTKMLGVFMPVAGQCEFATSPEHTHPAYLFTISFDTFCRLQLGGKLSTSMPSTLTLIPPDVPHRELPSDTVSRYMAVMIDRNYFEEQLAVYQREITPDLIGKALPVDQQLVSALKDFMAEYETPAPGYEQFLTASAQTITHRIIRLLFGISRGNTRITTRMSINKAIEYINIHYGAKLSIPDLAHAACLSPSHFSRIFKSETGYTPAGYLMKTRLDIAKRMLRTGESPVTDVAWKCGFNSSSYFSHCFFRVFNTSPSQFKRSLKIAES